MAKRIMRIAAFILAAVTLISAGGLIAVSVARQKYRNIEGTYVNHISNDSIFVDSVEKEGYTYSRTDILNVTENGDGYEFVYIVSVDSERPVYDHIYDDGYFVDDLEILVPRPDKTAQKEMITEDDSYREYHGTISKKAAAEGAIVECREILHDRLCPLGFSFNGDSVSVMNTVMFDWVLDQTPENFDSEYTLKEMFSVPRKDREYWIVYRDMVICTKTGYDVCAILGLAGNILGITASVCGVLCMLIAGLFGKIKPLAAGLAVSTVIAAASFICIPRQAAEGRYMGRAVNSGIANIFEMFTSQSRRDAFLGMAVSYIGDGKYTVLYDKGENVYADVLIAESDARGRLLIKTTDSDSSEYTLMTPVDDGMNVRTASGSLRDVRMIRESKNAVNMSLRYIILLPFAVSFVLLLIVSGRRYAYAKRHPVIPYGEYKVSDLIYIDRNLEYMRDYMLENWKGVQVKLEKDSFDVDGKSMTVSYYFPDYGDRYRAFSEELGMKRFVCINPENGENNVGLCGDGDAESRAEYRIVYNKKRRVLVYSVDGQTVAAFRLAG